MYLQFNFVVPLTQPGVSKFLVPITPNLLINIMFGYVAWISKASILITYAKFFWYGYIAAGNSF